MTGGAACCSSSPTTGASDNYWKIFSLDKAREVLGYEPQDDAGPVLDPAAEQLERDYTEFKAHPE